MATRQRTVKCDCCQQDFIQKWVIGRKEWSRLNEVEFWLKEDKNWNNYKLVCRSCLKTLGESKEMLLEYLKEVRLKTFWDYRSRGTLDLNDKV